MTKSCPLAEVALADLARRIAAELDHLAALSQSVQNAVSHCACTHRAAPQTLMDLQGIDKITQGITDLAQLMTNMGVAAPASTMLASTTLSQQMLLHGLIGRLLQPEPGAIRNRGASAPGEVVFFQGD